MRLSKNPCCKVKRQSSGGSLRGQARLKSDKPPQKVLMSSWRSGIFERQNAGGCAVSLDFFDKLKTPARGQVFFSLSKVSQSFASADAKSISVFCRDMCVAENTLRGVKRRIVRISGQQRRERKRIEKVARPLFFDSSKHPPAGRCFCYRDVMNRGATEYQ